MKCLIKIFKLLRLSAEGLTAITVLPVTHLYSQSKTENMGKIDGCLKAVFIAFNSLFTVMGSLMIYGLVSFGFDNQMEAINGPSIIWFWVFAIGMVGISVLGSQAARSENKCCLKVFAVFMGIGMIIMLIIGFYVVALKDKSIEEIQSTEVAKKFMKDDETKQELKNLQQHLQCCGWTGVEDWGTDIPDSCSCTSSYGSQEKVKCKPKPEGSTGPLNVYSKSCGEAFLHYLEPSMKLVLGILFGLSVIALIGFIIAVKMIKQISHHDSNGVPAFAMKAY